MNRANGEGSGAFGAGNLFRRLPEERVRQMMGQEAFAQAWPEPAPGVVATSLFE